MAFYNRKISTNKALVKAWKAGHGGKTDDDEEINVPEICDEISRWMRRDRRPRSRLSLRSFSVLLSGTIRLYRDQVDGLLRDSFACSLYKKPRTSKRVTTVKQEILVSGTEQITGNFNGDSEITVNEFNKTKSLEDNFDADTPKEATVYAAPYNDQTTNVEIQEEKEKRDQIVQTSPTPEEDNFNMSGFDPNLPFGYILIHDNYHSRIPSKIMFSNLNENINLYPFSNQ